MRIWIALLLSVAGICTLSGAPSSTAGDVYQSIGKRVWQNECAGSVQGLVSWNAGENFPSLGIGHFIWYPAGQRAPFEESFPKFISFAAAAGVQIPPYFRGAAPWPNKAAYTADKSGLSNRMRKWLAEHIDIQARFLIKRSQESLASMLRHSRMPDAVRARYNALARTTQGMYCLVDYVNFKGEGTKASERYAGQGWGLLQVLEAMRGIPAPGNAATAEFRRAAEETIRRRVQNAPAGRNESRWLPGWLNRCRTYHPQ